MSATKMLRLVGVTVAALACLSVPATAQDFTVGEEHKLFDEGIGLDALLAHNAQRHTFFIEFKFYFVVAEIYRSLLRTLRVEFSCEVAEST